MNCSDVRQEAYNCSDVKPEQLENQETTNLKSQISQLQSENSSLRKECNENSSIISSLREQISKKHYSEYNTWHDANCDSCGLQIKGYRYKCGNCVNFDLCDTCIGSNHNPDHMFLKIKYPINFDPRILLLPKFPFAPMETYVHTEISCDICGKSPICGIRYKCGHCQDFDICGQCELKYRETNYKNHDSTHVFIRLARPIHRSYLYYNANAPVLSRFY
ncbi:ubiquitin protein ligase [Gigaspora margarita]|uniref:Ubiquitin protein ligase n=1 Tax=Gigaspora margarita TaxID=4874 RepID=A0A8H3X0B6_GIGMA|nr:ubiquitin protein ligase [Gigaspora margarita]